MAKDFETLEKLRDSLLKTAAVIDELLNLEKRETAGETIAREVQEAALGRFLLCLLQLQESSSGSSLFDSPKHPKPRPSRFDQPKPQKPLP
jgi:hypothetical protein